MWSSRGNVFIIQKNPKILEEFLHIDIEQYIELMPMDIQEEYNMQTERKNGYE